MGSVIGDHTVGSAQSEELRALVSALGKRATAEIFGKEIRTIERWLEPGAALESGDERRLSEAFEVFSLLENFDDAEVARAWFVGMNPQLEDTSPVEQLAAGDARAVLAAARSYVNAG